MHNVIKHVRASRLAVNLRGEPSRVSPEVADDGIGFEVDLVGGDHFRRVIDAPESRSLGGEVTVTNAAGQVSAVIPR